MRNLIAIPDIHGRKDLLDVLMAKLYADGLDLKQDKLIFLGDMIDRGIDSEAVVRFIRNLQKEFPDNVVILAGNHEWLMIDSLAKGGEARHLWMMNGGVTTVNSFGCSASLHETAKWMASLPLSHEEPGFFFSHAPVPHGAIPGVYSQHQLTWSYPGGLHRESSFAIDHGGGVVGVCGHIHALRDDVMEPRFYKHYIYADAGCGCSRDAPLVAIDVRTRKVTYAWPIGYNATKERT